MEVVSEHPPARRTRTNTPFYPMQSNNLFPMQRGGCWEKEEEVPPGYYHTQSQHTGLAATKSWIFALTEAAACAQHCTSIFRHVALLRISATPALRLPDFRGSLAYPVIRRTCLAPSVHFKAIL